MQCKNPNKAGRTLARRLAKISIIFLMGFLIPNHSSANKIGPDECEFIEEYDKLNGQGAFSEFFLDAIHGINEEAYSTDNPGDILRKRSSDYRITVYIPDIEKNSEKWEAIDHALLFIQEMSKILTGHSVIFGELEKNDRLDFFIADASRKNENILDPKIFKKVYDEDNDIECGMAIGKHFSHNIEYAQIYVRPDQSPREISNCMKEGWLRSMGPVLRFQASVFETNTERRNLGEPWYDAFALDEASLLFFLYEESFVSGSQYSETRETLSKLISENCTGQSRDPE